MLHRAEEHAPHNTLPTDATRGTCDERGACGETGARLRKGMRSRAMASRAPLTRRRLYRLGEMPPR
jgi:hypothetical protein